MSRKMRRGLAGNVACRVCDNDVPITTAREDVELVARTYASGGTLTDVALMRRKNTWVCDRCVAAEKYGLSPLRDAALPEPYDLFSQNPQPLIEGVV